jgi:hypothetical protein
MDGIGWGIDRPFRLNIVGDNRYAVEDNRHGDRWTSVRPRSSGKLTGGACEGKAQCIAYKTNSWRYENEGR